MPAEFTAVTDQTFGDVVGPASGTVVLDFATDDCAPCHALQRVLRSLGPRLPDGVRVMTVRADENPGLLSRFEVGGVPTLLVLRDGDPVERLSGVDRPQVVRAAILRHHPGERAAHE